MNFFTELREGLSISFAAIRANKMRAALTTLGIVIGIVTVTLMGTAIEGLNRSFLQSVSTLGADVLYVDRQNWVNHSHAEWLAMMKRRELSIEQCRALEKQALINHGVACFTFTQGQATAAQCATRIADLVPKMAAIAATQPRPFLSTFGMSGGLANVKLRRSQVST